MTYKKHKYIRQYRLVQYNKPTVVTTLIDGSEIIETDNGWWVSDDQPSSAKYQTLVVVTVRNMLHARPIAQRLLIIFLTGHSWATSITFKTAQHGPTDVTDHLP